MSSDSPEPPAPDPSEANEPEPEPLTCVYQGCSLEPTHIHQEVSLDAGLELACDDHASEGAIPLDALDFTTPGRNHPHPRPEAVERLEIATHQVCFYWVKEHGNWSSLNEMEEGFDRESDDRTISVVVRDGDGELLGESQLWDYTGVYALVRDPEVPDDLPDLEEPPEPPSWAEWVRRDPPLDHHVKAVRCSACGEVEEHQFPRMPGHHARFETWDRIRHHGECEHASESDIETWEEQQVAEEIRDAPDPSVMALDCIWAELRELHRLRREWTKGYVEEAAEDRWASIESVLESRMLTRYPRCPECGSELRFVDEYQLACRERYHDDLDDAVYEERRRQERRVWGTRGQGDRGWEVPSRE